MNSKYFFALFISFMFSASLVMAQTTTERFQVSGNCGMCKSKIEKAAKDAGASSASWNEDSKELVVSFASGNSSVAQIQQKIAEVGYDNAGARATDASYNKLHGCCKYERTAASTEPPCCKGGVCTMANQKNCCKDGKCMAASKKEDCCKNGVCTKANEKNCCKDGKCTASSSKEDCCKGGKCANGPNCEKGCCAKS